MVVVVVVVVVVIVVVMVVGVVIVAVLVAMVVVAVVVVVVARGGCKLNADVERASKEEDEDQRCAPARATWSEGRESGTF